MAAGEIVASEAAFFGAEDEGSAAAAGDFAAEDGSEGRERDDGLLGLAMGEGPGAGDQCAAGYSFSEGGAFDGVFEDPGRADGGAGFAPVRRVGRYRSQVGEAEVGHGARGGSDVERIARGDEDQEEAIALGGGEQGSSVAPVPSPKIGTWDTRFGRKAHG